MPLAPARDGRPGRRPGGLLASAEHVLALQRTAGNRAASLAIQRMPAHGEPDARPAASSPQADKKDGKDLAGRAGEAGVLIGSGANVPWTAGAVTGQLGEGHTADTWAGPKTGDAYGLSPQGRPALADASTGAYGSADLAADIADSLGLLTSIPALRGAREAQEEAEKLGTGGSRGPSRRRANMEKTKVAFGAAGTGRSLVRSGNNAVGAAHAAGGASAHAALIGGTVAAPAGLAMAVANLARNTRKLRKQSARMRAVAEELNKFDESSNVQRAKKLLEDRADKLRETQGKASECRAELSKKDADIKKHADDLWRRAASGQTDGWAELIEKLQGCREEMRGCEERLSEAEARVRETEDEKRRDDEAYKRLADEGRAPAEEISNLKEGDEPSLKTIAYYAKAKNLKGAKRKTAQMISDGLGVAWFSMAAAALASGPAALGAAPASAALISLWCSAEMGIAGEKGKSYLTKRWRRTKGAYRRTGVDGEGNPAYERITGLAARARMTAKWKSKLYNEPGEDGTATEIKSHRTIMAEALWDCATNDKHAHPVREEAWKLIKTLTGRDKADIVGEEDRSADPKIREEALKLLQDKLASG